MIQDFVFERYFGYINFFLCKCMLDSLVEGLCRENVKTLALVLVCWATGFTCKTSLYNWLGTGPSIQYCIWFFLNLHLLLLHQAFAVADSPDGYLVKIQVYKDCCFQKCLSVFQAIKWLVTQLILCVAVCKSLVFTRRMAPNHIIWTTMNMWTTRAHPLVSGSYDTGRRKFGTYSRSSEMSQGLELVLALPGVGVPLSVHQDSDAWYIDFLDCEFLIA